MSRRAPIFVAVGAAVLVVISVFVLIMPKSAKIRETTDALATAEQVKTIIFSVRLHHHHRM